MPTLKQVLKSDLFRANVSQWLDVEVVAVKLNNGPPCDSHAGPFESWPGDEKYVRQWFVLANGIGVAINEDPDVGPSCAFVTLMN